MGSFLAGRAVLRSRFSICLEYAVLLEGGAVAEVFPSLETAEVEVEYRLVYVDVGRAGALAVE
jgi:hypothetical protein